jgi:carbamoylphosphate synthase large subunit
MFTYNRVIDSELFDGYKFYNSTICKTDADKDKLTDTLNIEPLLPEEVIKVIRQQNVNGISVDTIFKGILIKDSVTLPNTEWSIDWNKLEVIINNSDKLATYRLVLYANMPYLSSKIIDNMDSYK